MQSIPGSQGYFKYPHTSENLTVFCCDGDVWLFDWKKQKLDCLHLGNVRWPVISPNEELIAYSSSESGACEVYTLNLKTRRKRQVTSCGVTVAALSWKPCSKFLYVLSESSVGHPSNETPHMLDIETLHFEPLPLNGCDWFSMEQPETENNNLIFGKSCWDSHLKEHMGYKGGCIGRCWISNKYLSVVKRFIPIPIVKLSLNFEYPSENMTPSSLPTLPSIYDFSSTHNSIEALYSFLLELLENDSEDKFSQSSQLRFSISTPIFLCGRIFFIAEDFAIRALSEFLMQNANLGEGWQVIDTEWGATANVWSVDARTFADIQKHSNHPVFSARQLAGTVFNDDGCLYSRIHWISGGALYMWTSKDAQMVDVSSCVSPRGIPRLVDPCRLQADSEVHVDIIDIHPKGHAVAVASRGGVWELAVSAGSSIKLMGAETAERLHDSAGKELSDNLIRRLTSATEVSEICYLKDGTLLTAMRTPLDLFIRMGCTQLFASVPSTMRSDYEDISLKDYQTGEIVSEDEDEEDDIEKDSPLSTLKDSILSQINSRKNSNLKDTSKKQHKSSKIAANSKRKLIPFRIPSCLDWSTRSTPIPIRLCSIKRSVKTSIENFLHKATERVGPSTSWRCIDETCEEIEFALKFANSFSMSQSPAWSNSKENNSSSTELSNVSGEEEECTSDDEAWASDHISTASSESNLAYGPSAHVASFNSLTQTPYQAPLDLGEISDLMASPTLENRIALTNNHGDLIVIDLLIPAKNIDRFKGPIAFPVCTVEEFYLIGLVRTVVRNQIGHSNALNNLSWSPCGHWISFDAPNGSSNSITSIVRAANVTRIGYLRHTEDFSSRTYQKCIVNLTSPEFHSWGAKWSSCGKYICFLSSREFSTREENVRGSYVLADSTLPFVSRLTSNAVPPYLTAPFKPGEEQPFDDDDDQEGGRDHSEDSDSDEGENHMVEGAAWVRASGMDDKYVEDVEDAEWRGENEMVETEIELAGLQNRTFSLIGFQPGKYFQIDFLMQEGSTLGCLVLSGVDQNLVEAEEDDLAHGTGKLLSCSFFKPGKIQTLGDGLMGFAQNEDRSVIYGIVQKDDGSNAVFAAIPGVKLRLDEAHDEDDDDDFDVLDSFGDGTRRSSDIINVSDRICIEWVPWNEWQWAIHKTFIAFMLYFPEPSLLGLIPFNKPIQKRNDIIPFGMSEVLLPDLTILHKYLEVLDTRVSSREDVSDLLRDFVKEIGIGHCFVTSADDEFEQPHMDVNRSQFAQGHLGVSVSAHPPTGGLKITSIYIGDPWDESASGSLSQTPISVGDVILAINGRNVSLSNINEGSSLSSLNLIGEAELKRLLRNSGGRPGLLSVLPKGCEAKFIKALGAMKETPLIPQTKSKMKGDRRDRGGAVVRLHRSQDDDSIAFMRDRIIRNVRVYVNTSEEHLSVRYREWVRSCAANVRTLSGGRIGYVHIPDTCANGFQSFHRSLSQSLACVRDDSTLIVDLRYNSGGSGSRDIMQSLMQFAESFAIRRSDRVGQSTRFPSSSLLSPSLIVLTNERTGSDGEVLARHLISANLAICIGRRTWGSVATIGPLDISFNDGGGVSVPIELCQYVDKKAKDNQQMMMGIESNGVVPMIPISEFKSISHQHFQKKACLSQKSNSAIAEDNVKGILSNDDLDFFQVAVKKGLEMLQEQDIRMEFEIKERQFQWNEWVQVRQSRWLRK